MSRRWKIAIIVLFLIPPLAYLAVAGMIYRMLGRQYASGFVKGTLFGLQARPLTSANFKRTQARLNRGEHLTSVARCFSCHSDTDPQTDLPVPGRMGAGTIRQLAVRMVYSNITPDPSGISYFDEALFIRTMRAGHVGARELAAAMPWRYFRNFTDDDLKDIFSYLRTLRPVKHRVDNNEPPSYCKVCGQWH